MEYVLSHQTFTFDLHSCLSCPSFKDSHSSTQYWVQVINPVFVLSSWNTNWIASAHCCITALVALVCLQHLHNTLHTCFTLLHHYTLHWVLPALWKIHCKLSHTCCTGCAGCQTHKYTLHYARVAKYTPDHRLQPGSRCCIGGCTIICRAGESKIIHF